MSVRGGLPQPVSSMSEFDPRGDKHFSKTSENEKKSELSKGRGVGPNWDFFPIFFVYFLTPPLI